LANFALLNNADHLDLRIITERSAKYGDSVMYAITFPFEFRNIQATYPILFHRDAAGDLFPVALFGFQQGENLFLDQRGWHAHYVPAMIRRQPFLIGYQAPKDYHGSEPGRILSLDMDHPRVSREAGERLFQPLGGRTPFLEDTAVLLESLYEGFVHNKAFMAALQGHGLIESVTFDIVLDDGSKNQLVGFYAIDEDKVRELPSDTLGELNQQGFLMPLFMALASLSNVRTLVELKNERSRAGA
jgi:SapC